MRATSYLEWNEFKRVVSRLMDDGRWRDAMLFGVGVYCALRVSDLLAMTWEDIDGERIKIHEKKTGKYREIPISKELEEIIGRAAELCPEPTGKIFLSFSGNNKGGVMSGQAVNDVIRKVFDEYKVRYEGNASSHLFRKTLGRRVMEKSNYDGKSLILLSEALNHSNPVVTMTYLGLRQKEVESIYCNLG